MEDGSQGMPVFSRGPQGDLPFQDELYAQRRKPQNDPRIFQRHKIIYHKFHLADPSMTADTLDEFAIKLDGPALHVTVRFGGNLFETVHGFGERQSSGTSQGAIVTVRAQREGVA